VPTYDIEGGGDGSLIEDNYAQGGGNLLFLEITDARGSWSAVVRKNRIAAGMRIRATNSMGTLTQSENGPTATLTWDINRRPGRRGYRLPDGSPIPPDPIDPCAAVKLENAALKEQNSILQSRLDKAAPLSEATTKAIKGI
jgi:hypothetical protein